MLRQVKVQNPHKRANGLHENEPTHAAPGNTGSTALTRHADEDHLAQPSGRATTQPARALVNVVCKQETRRG